MKRFIMIMLSIIMVVTISSCSSKSSAPRSEVSTAQNAGGGLNAGFKSEPEAREMEMVADAKTDEVKSNIPSDNRKVIYNASVTLDVRDLRKAYDSITSKAVEMGGFISHSGINESSSQVTVRIPAEKLTNFLEYLDTLGGQNKECTIDTEDVTERYFDAQSNLRNLKAQEEQYLTILKKANTIDEIMKVQNEIYRVRGEIETLQGRINMWDNLIDLCTITIRLNKIMDMGGKDVSISFITWNEITKAMSNGFKSTLNFIIRLISGLFVFVVSIIPALPFIAAAVWLFLKYGKKIIKRDMGK